MDHKEYSSHSEQESLKGYCQQDQEDTQRSSNDIPDAGVNRSARGNAGIQLAGQVGVLDEKLALKLLQNPALPF